MHQVDSTLAEMFDNILGPTFIKQSERDWLVQALCEAITKWAETNNQ